MTFRERMAEQLERARQENETMTALEIVNFIYDALLADGFDVPEEEDDDEDFEEEEPTDEPDEIDGDDDDDEDEEDDASEAWKRGSVRNGASDED